MSPMSVQKDLDRCGRHPHNYYYKYDAQSRTDWLIPNTLTKMSVEITNRLLRGLMNGIFVSDGCRN